MSDETTSKYNIYLPRFWETHDGDGELSNETASAYISRLTRFWQFYGNSGTCWSATFVSLWFINLWIFTALAVFIFGHAGLRTRIYRSVGTPSLRATTVWIAQFMPTYGCMAIHTLLTLVTAAILKRNMKLGHTLLIWFCRPLPGAVVAAISRRGFHSENADYQLVEALYSSGGLALYGMLWRTAFTPSDAAKAFLDDVKSRKHSLQMMQAGIVIGMLYTLVGLVVACFTILTRLSIVEMELSKRKNLFLCQLFCNTMRTAAGFLLWIGALRLDQTAFCPTQGNIVSVTLLWCLFAPLADILWRFVFYYPDLQDDDDVLE